MTYQNAQQIIEGTMKAKTRW